MTIIGTIDILNYVRRCCRSGAAPTRAQRLTPWLSTLATNVIIWIPPAPGTGCLLIIRLLHTRMNTGILVEHWESNEFGLMLSGPISFPAGHRCPKLNIEVNLYRPRFNSIQSLTKRALNKASVTRYEIDDRETKAYIEIA